MASLKPVGSEPGTGKATVNKYWPAFSEAVGASCKKERWLKSVPAPAETLILGLLDWAQDHATAAISQERAETEARATEIAQAHADWLTEKALFQARISELALLNQGLKDETATLHADGRTLAQANSDLRAELAGQTQALAVATVELKHAAAQNLALTTQQARLTEQALTLEATVAAQSSELARERQANDNKAGQIVALQKRHDELIQLADDRLDDAQAVRREKAVLTDRVAQLDATAQDNRVALALQEQDRQSVAKEYAVLAETHERLVQHSTEQGHVIERLSRGFELDREQDGSVGDAD